MGKTAIVIPARYHSTRLPGKPLIKIAGKPLIHHVIDRAREIAVADQIVVATDDERILRVVGEYGAEAVLTPADLASGSDRVGWAARRMECQIVVNLQGDEPLIDTRAVEKAVNELLEDPSLNVATLGYPLRNVEDWRNENVVKVLTDQDGRALYFSRQSLPFFRGADFSPLPVLFQHIGVYIYRRRFLLNYLTWPVAPLEAAEKLEQLRILHHGEKIKVIPADNPSLGVDTPADVERLATLFT